MKMKSMTCLLSIVIIMTALDVENINSLAYMAVKILLFMQLVMHAESYSAIIIVVKSVKTLNFLGT